MCLSVTARKWGRQDLHLGPRAAFHPSNRRPVARLATSPHNPSTECQAPDYVRPSQAASVDDKSDHS